MIRNGSRTPVVTPPVDISAPAPLVTPPPLDNGPAADPGLPPAAPPPGPVVIVNAAPPPVWLPPVHPPVPLLPPPPKLPTLPPPPSLCLPPHHLVGGVCNDTSAYRHRLSEGSPYAGFVLTRLTVTG